MKKSELRNIIRESIKELMNEQLGLAPTSRKKANVDQVTSPLSADSCCGCVEQQIVGPLTLWGHPQSNPNPSCYQSSTNYLPVTDPCTYDNGGTTVSYDLNGMPMAPGLFQSDNISNTIGCSSGSTPPTNPDLQSKMKPNSGGMRRAIR